MKCLWGKNVEVLDAVTFLQREFNYFLTVRQSRRATDQLSPIRNRDCLRLSFNTIIKIDLPVLCPLSYDTALQQIPSVTLSQNNYQNLHAGLGLGLSDRAFVSPA